MYSRIYREAVRWLTSAAQKENQYAAFKLGKLYLDGRFIMPDFGQAEHWLAVAARLGSPYGQYALGKLYLDGPPYRPDAALALFHQAAEQDNTHAQLKLGAAIFGRRNHTAERPPCHVVFTASRQQGQPICRICPGQAISLWKGDIRDKEQAAYWLNRAASMATPMLPNYWSDGVTHRFPLCSARLPGWCSSCCGCCSLKRQLREACL